MTETRTVVTGATGHLGRPTMAALRAAGQDVVGLTSSGGPGLVQVNLLEEDSAANGLLAALAGADTVVHAATTNGRHDVRMAENLVAAASAARIRHLVLISIVGIERIPIGFYRDRVRIEEIALGSGVPLTILRATQFHSFVDGVFSAQRFSPVILTPSVRLQPIAVEDVAARLAELAMEEPAGRAHDIGGPAVRTGRDLQSAWRAATGSHRPALPLRFPGRLGAAYAAGAALVPGVPFGVSTFEDYLARRYAWRPR